MVGYRFSAVISATEHGLVGWVRNTRGDDVEIVAEGPAEGMDAFIKWCRIGARAALVEDVRVEWREPTGEFTRFDVRY
ncbi:MAG: acylphosphatase [Nitrospinae bacterium]|nr:acylphosphatase [Nitrospinota bacterium]